MSEPAHSRYNVRESEIKWQKRWEEQHAFTARDGDTRPKYYVLEMFPYPSGNIHMGHVRNYSLGDVIARARRMQGYNVLHPMGWDAFGLPAENAAIQNNSHPETWTLANIQTMRDQLKMIGLSYDWPREFATCLPDYYKHEQLFFLKFLEKGIAYRKEAEVNWDPVDNTVLANEQVIEGRGWRSGALVERKKLSQWFLRISDYAEDLLQGLASLDAWPDKVRLMQEKWIGKSYGATLKLDIKDRAEKLVIYTTRPDTIFGMSFCAISPGHPIAAELAAQYSSAADFIAECGRTGTSEEAIEKAEKKGYDTGLKIIHPFDGHEVPLYIANFVLMDYGTGAIFGCPAHDQRDLDFARKYNLPVLPVVAPKEGETPDITTEAFTDDGVIVNSPISSIGLIDTPAASKPPFIGLNGLSVEEAKKAAIAELERIGHGTAKVNYRLRDWGVSRQRYWGCPIPIIYCDACGAVPVPEKGLPVALPKDISFDKPGNPLSHHPTWKHVSCPSCGAKATRETDTFDTFFESSWYFARFCSPHAAQPFDKAAVDYWMPVDCYIGGIEHAVLHLLYSRFFSRALNTCGMVNYKEPFKRLETQGMICHETYKGEDGKWLSPDEVTRTTTGATTLDGKPVQLGRIEKMSKSKKNTVDPRHIITSYGADAARLFMLSDSPPERDLEWTDAGIDGAWRYINRLWKLVQDNQLALSEYPNESLDFEDQLLHPFRQATHKTIAAVTDDIERFHFNKAIARIRELTNGLAQLPIVNGKSAAVFRECIEVVTHLIAPFLPHIAEELWHQLGHHDLVALRPWPKADAALIIDSTVTIVIQVNGKKRDEMQCPKDADAKQVEAAALSLPSVADALKGKEVKKIVVVPNRIVNVVAQ